MATVRTRPPQAQHMPHAPRHAPQRTCVACRESDEKRSLTRLVRSADGRVQLDPTGRLPGRGAYLCGQPHCWERALTKGDALARALRAAITTEDRATLLSHAPASPAPSHDEGDRRDHE